MGHQDDSPGLGQGKTAGAAASDRARAARIAVSYAAVAAAWILCSDIVVATSSLPTQMQHRAEVLKGMVFVAVTAALLHLLVLRLLRRVGHEHGRALRALASATRSEKLLAQIAANVSDVIFAKDLEGRFILVNPAAARFVDRDAADILGRTTADLLPADQARRAEDDDRHVVATASLLTIEEDVGAEDALRTLITVKGPLHDEHGTIYGTFGVARDVTERRRAERELMIAAAAFETEQGMIVTAPDGVIQRVNLAFTRITGYSAEEAIGRTPRILQSGRQDDDFYTEMWQQLVADGYWQGELVNRHRNGDLFVERLSVSAVRDATGQVIHYVGSLSDVTREQEAAARAEHLSSFDPLTELPNRHLLRDRLGHALDAHARDHAWGALLMLNLDHFKNVNDSMGHDAGDGLLREASARLRLAVREGDTAARFGGDSFCVLIEDLGPEQHVAVRTAGTIAEKLVRSMSAPFALGDQSAVCTASIGVTMFQGGESSVETLLKESELAMYRAKAEGRGTLRFFEQAMQVAVDTRNAVETGIREGLAKHRFELYVQPQVDLDLRLIGAEGLVRWHHPVRGVVLPDAFIGVAEETGLIEELGRQVLEQACAALARWATEPRLAGLRLAVNVSARQFRRTDFVSQVRRALADAGADPRCLKLEVTESLVLEDIDDTVAKLSDLRACGITTALDDFGTGNSSLSYLTRLPLDQLKIDKSFVEKLPDSTSDALVTQTIIAMGKGLGLEVIAEGVETAEQAGFLAAHGCDAFQGFLYGRPMPFAAFEGEAADAVPDLAVLPS